MSTEKIFISEKHPPLREEGWYWISINDRTPEIALYSYSEYNKWEIDPLTGKKVMVGRERQFLWAANADDYYEDEVKVLSNIIRYEEIK
jgi:hypothetical protein